MKKFLRAFGASLCVALAACSGESKGTENTGAGAAGGTPATNTAVVRFTAIPNQNQTELSQKFQPVADYLSQTLGVKVEYVPSPDYSASVELFKNGQVHLAWLGGLTGVQARAAVAGAEVIACGGDDPNYKSYFIANPASGLTPSDTFPMALEGQTFTFGSESSTSGRLMPEHFITLNTGKTPEQFFGAPNKYSGSHDKTWEQVQNGSVMAGALDFKTYDRDLAAGKIDPAKCFILWTTPSYPDYGWNAHPELETLLGAGGVAKVKAALLAMKDPALLAAINRPEGLISATNADFEVLAGLARNLGLLR
jgi:phosphonate transport system substrate-binding protein